MLIIYNEYADNKLSVWSIFSTGVLAKPPQALFSAEEAQSNDHDVQRRRMPVLGETMYFWKNDFYRNGFLMKEVMTTSYITDENVKATVEEVQMFKEKKAKGFDDVDDFEGRSEISTATGIAEELADVEGTVENEATSVPFILGDSVQVIGGELKGVLGKVVSVDETNRLVRIQPQHENMTAELVLEADMLMKHIQPGAHVKVTEGAFLAQTGKVVCITEVDGSLVAAILTDGVNAEISVNVAHLQMTNEVAVGLSNLAGYELYDLVVLNQNETAVVTYVGQANLTVINHQGNTRRVQPMDLKGKRNGQSIRTTAFDASHNNVSNSMEFNFMIRTLTYLSCFPNCFLVELWRCCEGD